MTDLTIPDESVPDDDGQTAPEAGERALNATDLASGFGDPEAELEPGVVRREDNPG